MLLLNVGSPEVAKSFPISGVTRETNFTVKTNFTLVHSTQATHVLCKQMGDQEDIEKIIDVLKIIKNISSKKGSLIYDLKNKDF